MQPKKPRFNPLVIAIVLAAVLMVWSVLGGTGGNANGSSMAYSTVVHYFESNQVTKFSLDLNTGVITMTLKEGAQELPNAAEQTTTQSSGGLLSGLLSSSSAAPTGVKKNDDGTETVSYKLPYARMFVDHVSDYIAQYDAANPDAPMVYDYVPAKETIPWMEILFYLAMLGCTGFLLFSMMRGGAGGGGIMNVGKAKVKDEHENKKTATFADVAGEDEEKEELKEVVEFLKSPDKFNTLGARIPHGVLLVGDAKLTVKDVKKTPKGYYVHNCVLENGMVQVGQEAKACVSRGRRSAIARNHTGAHLLQAALREVLGNHVHQAGSYQDDERLRFDFTHFSAMTPEELALVEHIVNQKIFEALDVTVRTMPISEAKKMGAMALFGEKYGDEVRVVDINGWSTELCGGTHVTNTAQVGCFKIVGESSVAAGVRRIEATTGLGVMRLLDERTAMLEETASSVKANNLKDVPARAAALAAECKSLNKELEELKAKMASAKIDGLFENAVDVDGVKIMTAYLSGTTADALRTMCERVRDKAPNVVAALVGSSDGKLTLAVTCGKNVLGRGLKSGVLAKKIAMLAGGNGGGKPDFAMAGLKDATKVDEALNAVPEIVREELK